MKRREFVSLLGGAATWPFAARAQQPGPARRVGVLSGIADSGPEAKARITAFQESLQKLGWTDGRNLRIDYRWVAGHYGRLRAYAAELVEMKPDGILTTGAAASLSLREATRSVPIVFAQVPDPVEFGLVASLARPGGNITGFGLWDKELSAKWLELLHDVAPRVTRMAFVYDPANPSGARTLAVLEPWAATLGVQLQGALVRSADEIERAVDGLARESNGGLILLPSPIVETKLDLIIALAARQKLPAVYPYRYFAARGGLASYGIDPLDHYRSAASYVDRTLRGERPADLPVQLPTQFQLVINLKTAKALGLTIPESFLLRADEVIE